MDAITRSEKQQISQQEMKEKTENFWKTENINQEVLFEIINRIEIDEDKKVYVYFNFASFNC